MTVDIRKTVRQLFIFFCRTNFSSALSANLKKKRLLSALVRKIKVERGGVSHDHQSHSELNFKRTDTTTKQQIYLHICQKNASADERYSSTFQTLY